jgi:putative phosphoribosyl transferase
MVREGAKLAKGRPDPGVDGMFDDRRDAGRQLAEALADYRDEDVVVLAIPRGGVEVGFQVARALDADFSLVVVRKLPFPDNPEAGFGAIAEDGSTVVAERATYGLGRDTIERVAEFQREEIERRVQVLRRGKPLPDLKGRTVILVDDGIAMGSTMRASIQLIKEQGAGRIVVATPVASWWVAQEIEAMVDQVVVLTKPASFRAVAQVYQEWYDVPDTKVLEILDKWRRERTSPPSVSEE